MAAAQSEISGENATSRGSRKRVGLRFGPAACDTSAAQVSEAKPAPQKPAPQKPKRQKHKNDPKHVAAARELRGRYIEQINAGLLLPPAAHGKYDVSRQLEAAPMELKPMPLLKAA